MKRKVQNEIQTIKKQKNIDYKVEWSVEAGLNLYGYEVKNIRLNKPSIDNCYGVIADGSIFIKNLNNRLIRLLLHKNQIKKIIGLYSKSKRVIIFDHIYDTKGYIKVNLIVGEHLTKYDKRQLIIKKEEKKRLKRNIDD